MLYIATKETKLADTFDSTVAYTQNVSRKEEEEEKYELSSRRKWSPADRLSRLDENNLISTTYITALTNYRLVLVFCFNQNLSYANDLVLFWTF